MDDHAPADLPDRVDVVDLVGNHDAREGAEVKGDLRRQPGTDDDVAVVDDVVDRALIESSPEGAP